MRVFVGTSGWQYDDWRGPFYPPRLAKRHWLAFYSQRFVTVEVNNSFYQLPSEATFARWRDEVGEGFVFALKASRYITHIRRLRDCRQPLERFWSRACLLGPKAGPVLFQLPPRFFADPQRLAAFLEALPPGMRAAFEFRDPSWTSEDVLALLDRAGAAYVLADRPGARVPQVVTGGWSYVRFHQGGFGRARYSGDKLRRWARRIERLEAGEVWVYFNNDPGGAAVADARALARLLGVGSGS